MKIVIVGGGIIGVTAAYYLQKKGHELTVVDASDFTRGCSFGNAGYVSPSHFTPLASPGIIAQGLRWMLSASSPFYIKPRLNADLLRWGLVFRRSATKATMENNSVALNDLLQLSRRLTSEIKTEFGNAFQMQEEGCFMLYQSAETEKHEKELAEKAAAFGIETKVLDAAGVQALEPDVQVSVMGGVLYPIDAHLHPGLYMQTLLQHLEKVRVQFLPQTTVKGFSRSSGRVTAVETSAGDLEADMVILAAGSWLPQLTRMLGMQLLLQPGKGYSMTFENVQKNLRHPAILVDDRVAMTPLGNSLRMGGTMEISGINETIRMNRVQAIFAAAKKYYPDLPVQFPDVQKIWSGLRPLSPDGLPYIGRAPKLDNVYVAGGHAMLGVSLAAATGLLLQQMIDGKETAVATEAFRVERFNGSKK
ncbi:MAG: NAD(P)/FAD-dependent oxidoreductase [Flavisolibacter sp.]